MAPGENSPDDGDDLPEPEEMGESPHHGFQGDRAPAPPADAVPASLTIAIDRKSVV